MSEVKRSIERTIALSTWYGTADDLERLCRKIDEQMPAPPLPEDKYDQPSHQRNWSGDASAELRHGAGELSGEHASLLKAEAPGEYKAFTYTRPYMTGDELRVSMFVSETFGLYARVTGNDHARVTGVSDYIKLQAGAGAARWGWLLSTFRGWFLLVAIPTEFLTLLTLGIAKRINGSALRSWPEVFITVAVALIVIPILANFLRPKWAYRFELLPTPDSKPRAATVCLGGALFGATALVAWIIALAV